MSTPAAPGVPGSTVPPAADLDRRFYAFAVDRLLAWPLLAGAVALAWWRFLDDDRWGPGIVTVLAAVVVVWVGWALPTGLRGTTPGKALLGLRVLDADTGRPLGLGRGLLRDAVVGALTWPTAGLGLATSGWAAVMDPARRRRGLHDRLVRSVVVDVRPAPAPVEDEPEAPRQVVNLTALRLAPVAARPTVDAVPAATPGPAPGPTAGEERTTAVPTPAAGVVPLAAPATPPATPPSAAPVTPPAPSAPVAPPPRPAPAAPPAPAGPPPAPAPLPTWEVGFDTGETLVVAGLALVGRGPEPRAGEPVAHLVALRSEDMSLSKTHAQFQVAPDGALVVMDRGSTNGSVLMRQGVTRTLTAGRPTTLVVGDMVRFGDRVMTVHRRTP
ncbi:RDD family protein [Nocardioides sp.]|uniref:RDD family protein n=1 Tax=Nocardioides sp. TaxID=35761 RepID=UPI0035135782